VPPRSARFEPGAISAGLIVVVFCLLLLWHDPLAFWNDDYELSILPVFADVARSWSEGHWPILSPYSWVCGNLAGEFQYGTFSIFVNAAVVLIWKFPLTFSQQAAALSITHLFVLAAGAFLLARDRKFSAPLSTFVALVAALNGWIICWGATDWFGALGAFAWLPSAWWALERAQDRQRTRWRFLWPAPFVYLVVTGGFPYTVVMLALLIVWLSIKSLVETKNILSPNSPKAGSPLGIKDRTATAARVEGAGRSSQFLLELAALRARSGSILPMLLGVALGFGLSAPAWLAIFDYVHGSAREAQPSSAHWQWIVPPSALPGLILPSWTVKWADFSTRMMPHSATELACGLVPIPALIAGFMGRGRAFVKQIRWELFLLVLVLLLAMLPSAGLFRWSFRWLPFFHLVLAICAAEALRTLAQDRQVLFARPGIVALALVALTAITMSILRVNGRYLFPLTWILLAFAVAWALSEFFVRNELFRSWVIPCATFAAFLATYLCIPPNCGVPKYNLSQELTKPAPLDPQRLYLSVYPAAEFNYRMEFKAGPVGRAVRPGSTSMWAGLRFVNGYSPILTAGVARAFKFAIHGEIDPDVARHLLEKESGADGELAKLGIDGIVVAQEMEVDPQPPSEWQLAVVTAEGRVFYRKGAAFARVRSIASIRSRPNEEFVSAAISRIEDSQNRVAADVDVPSGDQPALLSFARPYFRGYQAHFGEKKLLVESHRGLFPVVQIPAGSHGRLILSYRPAWLVFGGGLSILCAVIWIGGMISATRTAKSRP
jgi:hypothetical protein